MVCLGDIVGYGPEPAECILLVQERCRFSLMGNHDYAFLHTPERFNLIAAMAIECQKHRFDDSCPVIQGCAAHRWFLEAQRETWKEHGAFYVHASPRHHLEEYILESDVVYGPNEKIRGVFEMIEGVCFVGHSHVPGVVTPDFRWLRPADADGLDVSRGKSVVNDGSVGQPRDRDPRACYVEWNDGAVFFHRVEYPFQTTMQKIEDAGCFHPYSALRLAEGK